MSYQNGRLLNRLRWLSPEVLATDTSQRDWLPVSGGVLTALAHAKAPPDFDIGIRVASATADMRDPGHLGETIREVDAESCAMGHTAKRLGVASA